MKADFEHDNDWLHAAKVSLTKQLGDPPVGFTISLKKPFDSDTKDCQANLILTHDCRS